MDKNKIKSIDSLPQYVGANEEYIKQINKILEINQQIVNTNEKLMKSLTTPTITKLKGGKK